MTTTSVAPGIAASVDRLDLAVGYLEEMRSGRSSTMSTSPTSFSGPLQARGSDSTSVTSSPRSLSWQRCRPVKEVLEEAQAKGSLVDSISLLESRVLKMEEDMEIGAEKRSTRGGGGDKKQHKKGLKKLVKSCVR